MARIELLPISKRVAVGLRMGRDLAGHIAAGARPIVDDEGLAEQLAKLLGDDARQDVARTARRKADHDGDRPLRIIGAGGGSHRGQTARAMPAPAPDQFRIPCTFWGVPSAAAPDLASAGRFGKLGNAD